MLVFARGSVRRGKLRWRDVDLANGRLRLRGTKTDAAERTVELLPGCGTSWRRMRPAGGSAGLMTPHSLRRTLASLRVALGRDPAVVMRQMGHTTPHMTLGVYTQAMTWRTRSGRRCGR